MDGYPSFFGLSSRFLGVIQCVRIFAYGGARFLRTEVAALLRFSNRVGCVNAFEQIVRIRSAARLNCFLGRGAFEDICESRVLQIAVLDPVHRTRELARRAICRLGHVPLIFTNAHELREHGAQANNLEVLFLACPRDPALFQPLIVEVREILGHRVPLIISAFKSQFRVMSVLHADAFSTVVHAPSSFEDTYRLLEAHLWHQRVPVAERVLEWRGYRFFLHQDKAEFDGAVVRLRPLEFDLAVAFFRNINRLLTREWLFTNVWGSKDGEPISRSLDVSISGLRRKLGLYARLEGPSLQAIWGQGYQLSEMSEYLDGRNQLGFLIRSQNLASGMPRSEREVAAIQREAGLSPLRSEDGGS